MGFKRDQQVGPALALRALGFHQRGRGFRDKAPLNASEVLVFMGSWHELQSVSMIAVIGIGLVLGRGSIMASNPHCMSTSFWSTGNVDSST